MDNDYIAILKPAEEHSSAKFTRLADTLHATGMCVRYTSGPLILFGTEGISTLSLPNGGILIGHLFTQDGVVVRDSVGFPRLSDPTQILKHILETYWGAYLIIQPDTRHPGAFTMTRAPSAAGNLPCIWSIKDGTGFLTSDVSLAIRVLLYRKQINWDFIAHRLRHPGIKTERTGFTGLVELLPGCSLRTSRSETSVQQAWSPWDFVAREHRYRDPRDAAAQVRHSVESAVRAWTGMDRSILLELSGGLDSSIVAACLRDCHEHVICCNLVTPVPGVDERQYARQMARQLSTELHTEHLGFDNARFDFTPPPNSVAPTTGLLQYAVDKALEAAAEYHGATAYYTGGGGDSVFCYLRTAAPSTDAWRAHRFSTAITAARDLASVHQCTFWKATRLTLSKLRRPLRSPFHPDPTFLTPNPAYAEQEAHPWFAAPMDALPGDRERIFDLAGNQLFESQAARGYRRSLRFPLLSQPVIEACLRAPSWMWIAGGRNRAVARTAFSDLLPPDVLNRQSKATYMSYLGAVYERNKHQIEDFLLSGRLRSQGFLDTCAISTFFSKPLLPRDRTFLRMFDLCMVENWVRHQP
ncbi:asparagine synthase C-terminal domain-containing protein [Fulvimonas sp. R45]|uniref:asparagine synthase-related protein n=1 Tax=Fulvimonas sp. R45 TaxID=3045937 RepID=UPI00265E23DF|nr:asparagine synthase C-terminal domain-containing protein [Fulvimonas sp. R45]MDO1529569.1 asparagine synthase C-terminal domain-containing protein [Fulvimonas sp. R45]